MANEEDGKGEMVKLSVPTRLAYSLGHVLNDLCASLWFSYLLLFLTSVMGFSDRNAGILMLIGQVTDGLATPLAGLASDRGALCCPRYGRRKSWHLAGSVMVAFSFPFVFQRACPWPSGCDPVGKLLYAAAFICIFQVGWAVTQVAHVALITDLTPDSGQRVALNAYRHSWTVASGICVYSATWVIFGVNRETELVGPKDSFLFMMLSLGVVAFGSVLTIVFHVLVKEPPQLPSESLPQVYRRRSCSVDIVLASHEAIPVTECASPTSSEVLRDLTWRGWFCHLIFYEVAVVYTMGRLYNTLFQVYLPLYLQRTLSAPKYTTAVLPLVSLVSAFVTAFGVKFADAYIGRKVMLMMACAIGLASVLWVEFGHGEEFLRWQLYLVAILFGSVGAALQISSLALTTDMIGQNKKSGAFVFGAMGFADKLTSGITVLIVQEVISHAKLKESHKHFRHVISYGCGLSVAVVTVMILIMGWRARTAKAKQNGMTEEKNEAVA